MKFTFTIFAGLLAIAFARPQNPDLRIDIPNFTNDQLLEVVTDVVAITEETTTTKSEDSQKEVETEKLNISEGSITKSESVEKDSVTEKVVQIVGNVKSGEQIDEEQTPQIEVQNEESSDREKSLNFDTRYSTQVDDQYNNQDDSNSGDQSDVETNFYYFANTDEEEEEEIEPEIRLGEVKKRVNVLFVKAPTYGHIVKSVLPVEEEKTAVYVLVKKPDELQYRLPEGAKLVRQGNPDVFYIKYKTQAEAERAIKHIQGVVTAKGAPINARILGNDNEFLRSIQHKRKSHTNSVSHHIDSRNH